LGGHGGAMTLQYLLQLRLLALATRRQLGGHGGAMTLQYLLQLRLLALATRRKFSA